MCFKIKYTILAFLFFCNVSFAQFKVDSILLFDNGYINNHQQQIALYFDSLTISNNAVEKESYTQNIFHLFKNLLNDTISFYHPLSDLNKMGKIYATDSTLRIYNWNYIISPGVYKYFGFIQYRSPVNNSIVYIQLNDSGALERKDDTLTLSVNNWYGALYYDAIAVSYGKNKYYTLLGVDYNSLISSKKVIENIMINPKGEIIIGVPIIFIKGDYKKRMVFEYSANISMTLKHNRKNNLIVFDHLSPIQSKYEGKYEFYGPDFSYDALEFRNGAWIYKEDIDIKNQ
jgi:hypothetical protein